MNTIIYILYYILISILLVILILYITYYENPQNKSLSSKKSYFFSNKDKINILAIETLDKHVYKWLSESDKIKEHPNRIYDILRSYNSYYSVYYNDETIKSLIPGMINTIKTLELYKTNPILLINILYILKNDELNQYFYDKLQDNTLDIDIIENAFYIFILYRLTKNDLTSETYIKCKEKISNLSINKHLYLYVLLHIFNDNNILIDDNIINYKALKKFSTKIIYKVTPFLNIVPIIQQNAYDDYSLLCYMANFIFNNSLTISNHYGKSMYNKIIKSAKIIKYYVSSIPINYVYNIIKNSNPVITDNTHTLVNRKDFSIYKPNKYIIKYDKSIIISTLSNYFSYIYCNKLYIQLNPYTIISVDVNFNNDINVFCNENIGIVYDDKSIIILYKYITTISDIHNIKIEDMTNNMNSVSVSDEIISVYNSNIYLDTPSEISSSSDNKVITIKNDNPCILKYFNKNFNVKVDNNLITIDNYTIKK